MARFFEPIMQALDTSANSIVGATLDFFEEGTTTPLDTFQDAAGQIPNTNPVVSTGGGLFPDIFLQSAIYTVVYKDASAIEIWSTDVDGTESPLVTEAISSAGITGSSDENLAEAIARYAETGGVFYEDNGAADAYVLAALGSFITAKALLDGKDVRFRPANTNTGASTVNVNTLGVKDVVAFDGAALTGGELTVGNDITLIYDLANDRFKIFDTTTAATKAEQETGTSKTVFVTPENQKFNQSAAKSWGNWDGSTAPTLGDSFNMTSITDNGTGDFTANIDNDMANTNYTGSGDGEWLNAGAGSNSGTLLHTRAVGTLDIETSSNGTISDVNNTGFHIFGELA